MSSETNLRLRIPVIDFSVQPLKPRTPEWESVKSQVRKALEEFGCFEALFDKIPLEIFDHVQNLFELPLETKQQSVSNNQLRRYNFGYKITQEELPYETLTIDDVNIHQNVESFTNILWPQRNPSFCKTTKSYTDVVLELDQIIKRMIFESLGIEKYLEELMESTNYALRFMKYKEAQISGTKQLGLTAHTDKGLVSILNQNQVDGLEVQTKDGQWISFDPAPGSFMVILGEALSRVMANGRLHCPLHRVMMTGNKKRYSVRLLSNPTKDYLIKTPEELVDEEHPLMFKPYYFFEFMRLFITDGTESAGV